LFLQLSLSCGFTNCDPVVSLLRLCPFLQGHLYYVGGFTPRPSDLVRLHSFSPPQLFVCVPLWLIWVFFDFKNLPFRKPSLFTGHPLPPRFPLLSLYLVPVPPPHGPPFSPPPHFTHAVPGAVPPERCFRPTVFPLLFSFVSGPFGRFCTVYAPGSAGSYPHFFPVHTCCFLFFLPGFSFLPLPPPPVQQGQSD